MVRLNKLVFELSKIDSIKSFFRDNQERILMTIGMILVGIVCFGLGKLSKIEAEVPIEFVENKSEEVNSSNEISTKYINLGKYIGDIRGNIYYAVTQAKIDEIGEDNLIWFDSTEDAQEQGYSSIELDKLAANNSEDITAISGQYVASKNGTKYYLPSCSGAKRIKEENKVYFSSKEEAEAQGLEPAKNCKGLE